MYNFVLVQDRYSLESLSQTNFELKILYVKKLDKYHTSLHFILFIFLLLVMTEFNFFSFHND